MWHAGIGHCTAWEAALARSKERIPEPQTSEDGGKLGYAVVRARLGATPGKGLPLTSFTSHCPLLK